LKEKRGRNESEHYKERQKHVLNRIAHYKAKEVVRTGLSD
jgi:hypothetical protein